MAFRRMELLLCIKGSRKQRPFLGGREGKEGKFSALSLRAQFF